MTCSAQRGYEGLHLLFRVLTPRRIKRASGILANGRVGAVENVLHLDALCSRSTSTRPDDNPAGRLMRPPRLPKLKPSRMVPRTLTRAPSRGTPCSETTQSCPLPSRT